MISYGESKNNDQFLFDIQYMFFDLIENNEKLILLLNNIENETMMKNIVVAIGNLNDKYTKINNKMSETDKFVKGAKGNKPFDEEKFVACVSDFRLILIPQMFRIRVAFKELINSKNREKIREIGREKGINGANCSYLFMGEDVRQDDTIKRLDEFSKKTIYYGRMILSRLSLIDEKDIDPTIYNPKEYMSIQELYCKIKYVNDMMRFYVVDDYISINREFGSPLQEKIDAINIEIQNLDQKIAKEIFRIAEKGDRKKYLNFLRNFAL